MGHLATLNFSLGEDIDMLRDTVNRFAADEIAPRAAAIEEANLFPHDLWRKLGDLGVLGLTVSEEYGGAQLGYLAHMISMEEISRASAAVGLSFGAHSNLCVNQLHRNGNSEQKAKYLPKLVSGEHVGALAMSEPNAGSDVVSMKLRAERKGDRYVLNGSKMWITNGGDADTLVVYAKTDPDAGPKGITAFIIEKDFPGFTVGKKEDKLGIRASSTCELILEDCRVPRNNVLGEVGKGYKIAIETLNEGRIGIGAQMLGVARGAWEYAAKYAQERKQFGKPLSDFQGIQFQIAQMATDIEAARLLVYNAARMKDAGVTFVKEAAMTKLFCSQVAERVTSLAIEIYGGYGFTKDYPVEKYWRDSKIGKIYEGTSNMQLQTIAKLIIGK